MELLTSVICDSASDYNGKLCILGAFDTIWSVKYPNKHPNCTLALRFLFNASDMGKHQFKVVFVNADGKELLPNGPLKFGIQIGPIPDKQYFMSRNLTLNMQGLPPPWTRAIRLLCLLERGHSGPYSTPGHSGEKSLSTRQTTKIHPLGRKPAIFPPIPHTG